MQTCSPLSRNPSRGAGEQGRQIWKPARRCAGELCCVPGMNRAGIPEKGVSTAGGAAEVFAEEVVAQLGVEESRGFYQG